MSDESREWFIIRIQGKEVTMGHLHHSTRMLSSSSRVDEIIKIRGVITKMWWWEFRKCLRHSDIADLNRVEASHKCIVKEEV